MDRAGPSSFGHGMKENFRTLGAWRALTGLRAPGGWRGKQCRGAGRLACWAVGLLVGRWRGAGVLVLWGAT